MNYQYLIKELRNKMLLTQKEFDDRLGVSFETVNRWENGKNMPTMKIRRQLAPLFKKYSISEGGVDYE